MQDNPRFDLNFFHFRGIDEKLEAMQIVALLLKMGLENTRKRLIGLLIKEIMEDLQIAALFINLIVEFVNSLDIAVAFRMIARYNHIIEIADMEALGMKIFQKISPGVNGDTLAIPA